MSKEFKIQVPKEHYDDYDDVERFISYFYQIDLVRKLKPGKVLEIGVGNKTVANYLKQNKINIETCDFDKDLKPDYVADIRDLPFADNSYDIVMACEILEHLPWSDVDKALSELSRISRKYVIISIPYSSARFELILRFPLIKVLMRKPVLDLFFRIPYFFREIKFLGQHYWEMGRKGYSAKKVRTKFRKFFHIIKEERPLINSYHHFFVLKKRNIYQKSGYK